MQNLKSFSLLCCVLALCACATQPQIQGESSSTVSICAYEGAWKSVYDVAQAHCQKFGKNAELISDKGGSCIPTNGITMAPTALKHFRCVNP